MGNLSSSSFKRKEKLTLYDSIVALYIIALFVFENERFSSVFNIIQLLFLGYTAIELFQKRKIKKSFSYEWAALFLVVAIILTSFRADSEYDTIRIILKNVVRCYCFTVYCSTEKRVKNVIFFIAIGGIICAGFLLQYFLGADIEYLDFKYASDDRVGEEIAGGNVNIVAMNMTFAFSAFLYFLRENTTGKKKLLCISGIILIVGTSLLTGTRKIILYYLVVLLIYNVFASQGKIRNTFIMVIGLLIGYYCILTIEPLYYLIGHKVDFFGGNSLYKLYNYSDEIRSNLIYDGVQLFYNHPLGGIGFGNTVKYLGVYAHNNYVEILASGGLIGFFVYYVAYIYVGWKSAFRFKFKNDNVLFYIFYCLIGLLVLEFLQVTYLYGIPWLFFALSTTYCRNYRSYNKKKYLQKT